MQMLGWYSRWTCWVLLITLHHYFGGGFGSAGLIEQLLYFWQNLQLYAVVWWVFSNFDRLDISAVLNFFACQNWLFHSRLG